MLSLTLSVLWGTSLNGESLFAGQADDNSENGPFFHAIVQMMKPHNGEFTENPVYSWPKK